MFWYSKSPITSSPLIAVVLSLILLIQLNFLFSNVWRCVSARAMTEIFTSSEELREGEFALCVTVISAPIVVYGQGGYYLLLFVQDQYSISNFVFVL